jgi:hypothetical protein
MFLILTLVGGGLDVVLPGYAIIKYATTFAWLAGFALVITSAVLVLIESRVTQRQLNDEVLDVPDLARGLGQEPGSIEN